MLAEKIILYRVVLKLVHNIVISRITMYYVNVISKNYNESRTITDNKQ